jgi:hemoglobin/transferrin/lactoferrin receptor protein
MLALLLSAAASVPVTTLEPMEVTITGTRASTFVGRSTFAGEELTNEGEVLLPLGLRDIPGVSAQQTTRGQAATIVRGMIGSSVLTLVDGFRLNSTIFRAAPNQYQALIDPFAVDVVEVDRGIGNARHGSDALGGVINLSTEPPIFESNEVSTKSRVLARFGTADSSRTLRGEVAIGRSDFAAEVGATYQASGDLDPGGDLPRQSPTSFSAYSADGAFALRSKRRELALGFQFLRQPETPRYDELVPGFGQEEANSSLFLFEPNQRLFSFVRFTEHDLFGIDRFNIQAGLQIIDDDRRTRDLDATEEVRERNRDASLTLIADGQGKIADLIFWTVGTELVAERVNSTRTVLDLGRGQSMEDLGRFPDGAKTFDAAIFAQVDWPISSLLRAGAGGRYTHFLRNIPEAGRGVASELDGDVFSGDVSLRVRPWEQFETRLRFASGFRAPNVFDLSTLGPRPGNRYMIPNANLRIERAEGVDLGFLGKFPPLNVELVMFLMRLSGRIEAAPNGEMTEDGRMIVESRNLRRTDLVGAELAASLQLHRTLELRGSFTAMYGEDEAAEGLIEPTDRVPPPAGYVAVKWNPGPVAFDVYSRFAFRQDRLSSRDKTDPRINPEGTPSWVTFNARGAWEFAENIRLIAVLENIFDEAYREHGSGVASPGAQLIAMIEARL